jgi:hypothetical protein
VTRSGHAALKGGDHMGAAATSARCAGFSCFDETWRKTARSSLTFADIQYVTVFAFVIVVPQDTEANKSRVDPVGTHGHRLTRGNSPCRSTDKKQRLPVFFCEFKDPANGLTITGDWLPYVFVSGVLAKDKATLAHEMVHASGIPGHDRAHRDNIMSEVTDNRSELFRSQIQQLAGAYFAR